MRIYQRCLSKSLIFFSILCFSLFLFIQSNIGFKWIFNFANHFFIELKVEKISGNWRNFLLKNIQYDILGMSIKADSIRIKLDPQSFFNISTIVKEIQTKNLIISLKKNLSNNVLNTHALNSFIKSNVFIKYPIIFQKIHIDTVLIRCSKTNILFSDFVTYAELISHHITFSSTYVHNVRVMFPNLTSSKRIFKKKYTSKKLYLINQLNDTKKVHTLLKYVENFSKTFFRLNINIKNLQCHKMQFFNNAYFDLLHVVLQAKIKDDILRIKNLIIDSSFLKIKSFGTIRFHHHSSMISSIHNQIIIPALHYKKINVLFNFRLNKKFVFVLKSKSFDKFTIYGSAALNDVGYPFFIKLYGQNLLWPITNKDIVKINNVNGCIKGTINNYLIYLHHSLYLKEFSSIVANIQGQGNLDNISLKKIDLFSINKHKAHKKIRSVIYNKKYNEKILKLIGNVNILSKTYNKIKYLYFPKINLKMNIMKKKLSILGSLYYQNNNILNIPQINVLIGKNRLSFQGLIGEKYNISSSIYANNLNYFFPGFKGMVKAKAKLQGSDKFRVFTGKILLDAKEISFHNFYINRLHVKTDLYNFKQKFYFLLKNKNFDINVKINGKFNKETRVWNGLLKDFNIKTLWGTFKIKKELVINYHNIDKIVNSFYKISRKKTKILSSTLYNKKLSFLNLFNKSSINFKSTIFIKSQLHDFLGKKRSNGKIFLTSYNIELEKNQNKKIFLEKIDYLKISIHLINNNLQSRWMIKKFAKSSGNKIIFGYINIMDVYNKKNIHGELYLCNVSISLLNFFTTNTKQIYGYLNSKIKFFGTLNQPRILFDIHVQDILLKKHNVFKYITLFFPYFSKTINTIKIHQDILIKTGNILFELHSYLNHSHEIEWRLIFNSPKISVLVFPKIALAFSADLNLHYQLSKYDLTGFIKLPFFCLSINEKNFLF